MVAYGLSGIRNYRLSDGTEFQLKRVTASGLERVKKSHLEKIYHERLFTELAGVIWMLSNPDPLSSGVSG